MDDTKITDSANDFDLGILLGTRKAFAAIAGRCSAADAECLRRLRDQKIYLGRAATWAEFCPKFLGLSKTQANMIIRNLEEFGPDYFEVAQLTRITPEQFRAIAPAIRDKNIHVNGQPIALIPANSDRVAAAVAELRQASAPMPSAPSVQEGMATLGRRFQQLAADFEEFAGGSLTLAERSQLGAVLSPIILKLECLHRRQRP
ncbi:MAG TPA: hypothetical protein VMB03_18830 [Bryobacteraceae bacterium]|nr:hypothetical protein [Bryobacteraceae bacterium]